MTFGNSFRIPNKEEEKRMRIETKKTATKDKQLFMIPKALKKQIKVFTFLSLIVSFQLGLYAAFHSVCFLRVLFSFVSFAFIIEFSLNRHYHHIEMSINPVECASKGVQLKHIIMF